MKPEELEDEIERLAKAATDGPWWRSGGVRGRFAPKTGWTIRGPERVHVTATGQTMSIQTDIALFHKLPEREANAELIVALRNNLPAILSALRRVEKLEAALEKIAHGPVGTLDPLGDGGTYCLTGNEWLTFRKIARQALTGEA